MRTGPVYASLLLLSLALGACDNKPSTTSATQPTTVETDGQVLCPVGGGKAKPTIFTEYQGKKVYFCCEGCIKPFQRDPEKYVKNLPQFGGTEEAGSGGMGM